MSIHAITPETEAKIRRQRRASFITGTLVGVLSVVLLMLILSLFLLAPLFQETPTVVTYESSLEEIAKPEEMKLSASIIRNPSPPSSSMAKVIAARISSPMAVPVPDVDVTTQSMAFGAGDNFGDGWDSGTGAGMGGGGASFFKQKVKAGRVAYVIDYSNSMSGPRENLMRSELRKSVKGLAAGMSYQMIFFAGPSWVAGDEVTMAQGRKTAVVKAGGGSYQWATGGGAHGWEPKGGKRKADWISSKPSLVAKSLQQIESTQLVWGTNWKPALEMAMAMEPPPQVIFFMTDGVTGGDSDALAKSLATQAKGRKIVINTVAMMEPKAEAAMKDLAKRTGGQFTIIEKGGKTRQVPLN